MRKKLRCSVPECSSTHTYSEENDAVDDEFIEAGWGLATVKRKWFGLTTECKWLCPSHHSQHHGVAVPRVNGEQLCTGCRKLVRVQS